MQLERKEHETEAETPETGEIIETWETGCPFELGALGSEARSLMPIATAEQYAARAGRYGWDRRGLGRRRGVLLGRGREGHGYGGSGWTPDELTRALAGHMLASHDRTLKVDGGVDHKRACDPRSWDGEAGAGMAARVVQAGKRVGSADGGLVR